MNLQQTVSKILDKEVSIEEAKEFAFYNYGTLCAYNRKLDQKVKGYDEYQFFIFSQLFMPHIGTTEPYDLIYPIIVDELKKFLDSDFNVDTKSEYDCMEDYLWANADTISLKICDHVNT